MVTTFTCSICRKEYDTEAKAQKCEAKGYPVIPIGTLVAGLDYHDRGGAPYLIVSYFNHRRYRTIWFTDNVAFPFQKVQTSFYSNSGYGGDGNVCEISTRDISYWQKAKAGLESLGYEVKGYWDSDKVSLGGTLKKPEDGYFVSLEE